MERDPLTENSKGAQLDDENRIRRALATPHPEDPTRRTPQFKTYEEAASEVFKKELSKLKGRERKLRLESRTLDVYQVARKSIDTLLFPGHRTEALVAVQRDLAEIKKWYPQRVLSNDEFVKMLRRPMPVITTGAEPAEELIPQQPLPTQEWSLLDHLEEVNKDRAREAASPTPREPYFNQYDGSGRKREI